MYFFEGYPHCWVLIFSSICLGSMNLFSIHQQYYCGLTRNLSNHSFEVVHNLATRWLVDVSSLGYVSLVPYQPRVRLSLVQDHQRWSTCWENGIWTVSTFTCDDDLNRIRWINVDQRLWCWTRPRSNLRLVRDQRNVAQSGQLQIAVFGKMVLVRG